MGQGMGSLLFSIDVVEDRAVPQTKSLLLTEHALTLTNTDEKM